MESNMTIDEFETVNLKNIRIPTKNGAKSLLSATKQMVANKEKNDTFDLSVKKSKKQKKEWPEEKKEKKEKVLIVESSSDTWPPCLCNKHIINDKLYPKKNDKDEPILYKNKPGFKLYCVSTGTFYLETTCVCGKVKKYFISGDSIPKEYKNKAMKIKEEIIKDKKKKW